MTEAELLAEVTVLCDHLGLLWHHDPDSRRDRGSNGFPDLVIAGRVGFMFRELKTDGGEASGDQEEWGWRLTRAVRRIWDVWRPVDLRTGRIQAELEEIC